MSARNFLSAGEKNLNKIIDCLPNINKQRLSYRPGQDLPVLSSKTSGLVNRNLKYSFEAQPYVLDNYERAGTPFSDFFSESETGTPDFRSEESDSSAGSILLKNTAEATKILASEWECIERTLYDEDGEKSTRPQIIEECKQWRQLHPHLRIVGKAIRLPEKRLSYKQMEHEEVIAVHYSDYEQFSESEERLSQSSTDVTPQNSPRVSVAQDFYEPKLTREKVSFLPMYDESEFPDTFWSLLQVTPLQIHSPLQTKRQSQSILKSDVASSRWMKSSHRDMSGNCDRNSAKSFVSLDMRSYGNMLLSASERNKMFNSRVVTARHRDLSKLEPLCTPNVHQNDAPRFSNGISNQYNTRKVSLPPLLPDDERRKVPLSVGSAKKHNTRVKKNVSKSQFQLDRVRH